MAYGDDIAEQSQADNDATSRKTGAYWKGEIARLEAQLANTSGWEDKDQIRSLLRAAKSQGQPIIDAEAQGERRTTDNTKLAEDQKRIQAENATRMASVKAKKTLEKDTAWAAEKAHTEKLFENKRIADIETGLDTKIGSSQSLYDSLSSLLSGYATDEETVRDKLLKGTDEAFNLTTGDRTAQGQLAEAIGQQMGTVEDQTMANLVNRGLGGGASGVAQRNLGQVAIGKNQALSSMMKQVQDDRIKFAQNNFQSYLNNIAKQQEIVSGQKKGVGDLMQGLLGAKNQARSVSNDSMGNILKGLNINYDSAHQAAQSSLGNRTLDFNVMSEFDKNKMQQDRNTMSDEQFKLTYGLDKAKHDQNVKEYEDSKNIDWGKFATGLATTAVGGLAGGVGQAFSPSIVKAFTPKKEEPSLSSLYTA